MRDSTRVWARFVSRSNQFYHVALFDRNEINIERVVYLIFICSRWCAARARASASVSALHRGIALDVGGGESKFVAARSRMVAHQIL